MADSLPARYGRDQLFAFSGFEGPTDPWHGLIGSAQGDRCGYWFHVNSEIWNDHGLRVAVGIARGSETAVLLRDLPGFDPAAVLGDSAEFELGAGVYCRFTMVDDRRCRIQAEARRPGAVPCLEIRALLPGHRRELHPDRLTLRYKDDGFTILAPGGGLESTGEGWILRGGPSLDACVVWHPPTDRVGAGAAFETDTTALLERRAAWTLAVPVPPGLSKRRQEFLRRCAVSLRTNSLSAFPPFRHGHTTPDRWPHRNAYLWDSAFQAIGMATFDPDWAWQALAAMWSLQDETETGFIPSMISTAGPPDHFETNSPVLAWAALEISRRDPRREPLEAAFDPLDRYIADALARRDPKWNNLVVWKRFSHGMDNSPRFDGAMPAVYVDANIYLANDIRSLAEIARKLGRSEEERRLSAAFDELTVAINDGLWDPQERWYYDLDPDGHPIRVKTPVPFAAVLGGVTGPAGRDEIILERLLDPAVFWRPLPPSTVAADEPSYGDDMWRGPAWPNLAHVAYRALQERGRPSEAAELANRWLREGLRWYEACGGIYEFYDAEAERCALDLPRKSGVGALNDYGFGLAVPLAFAWEEYDRYGAVGTA